MTWRRRARTALTTMAFFALTTVWLIPVAWMYVTSIKPNNRLFTRPPQWLSPEWVLTHYEDVLNNWPFVTWMVNSTIIAVGATLLSVLISVPAAYSFSRLQWPGRNVVFVIMIATMLIPWQINVIPLYFIMNDLRLLNTQWAIILPVTAMPVGVFLLRQFFINIPREIEDAAQIDGCSSLGILLRIILPMSTPALSALAIFVFIFTWNEFFWSMIALQRREVFTIPIGLRALQGAYDIQYGLLMAAAALASLPALLVYLALQRQIIAGITMSSAEIK